ncbi:MAG: tetratricopeptide repeat protein [Bordetella sp.]|nr:MAG: tetratricopeptide repeat protein [Bordetella sp.]
MESEFFSFKTWFLKSIPVIACLIFFFISISSGIWIYLKNHQICHLNDAMRCFEALEQEIISSNDEKNFRIKTAIEFLRDNYGDTIYSAIGVLISAQAFHISKNFDNAYEELVWLSKQERHGVFQYIARLRLANLLLDEKRWNDALCQLENPPIEFSSIFFDRAGDIFIAQGNKEDARNSWNNALSKLNEKDELYSVIKLKIHSL